MNPIQIYYRFDYFHKKDIMQFSIKVGLAPVVLIGMDAESFFNLCEGVVGLGHPFLEDVKRKRAQGIKEDSKVEFNMEQWEKMMGTDKEEKQDGQ